MPERDEDHATESRRLVALADRLIPETQAAIERAKEAIKKNQDCLDRIEDNRMPEPVSAFIAGDCNR